MRPARILILLTALTALVAAGTGYGRKTKGKTPAKTESRTSATVRKEKQSTDRAIADTRRRLDDNRRQTREKLDRLGQLDDQINSQSTTIRTISDHLDGLEQRAAAITDSIALLNRRDSVLRQQLARSLRDNRDRRRRINPLTFVLQAQTFGQAWQRHRYVTEFGRARKRLMVRLESTRTLLKDKELTLADLRRQDAAALSQLNASQAVLDSRRSEARRQVDDLKRQGSSLNTTLDDMRRKARQLDAELDRLIQKEAKAAKEKEKKKTGAKDKPAKTTGGKTAAPAHQGVADTPAQAPAGSFASNKGRLMMPVTGAYTIVRGFGRSTHSDIAGVQVDNAGIDLSVAPGTPARAVFDGTVSSIFFMEGYENIIIVRHGGYLTVYAGVKDIKVKPDQTVKAGQTLGTVATDDGRTVLHFEVRNERTKLNPLDWLKR